VELATRHQEVRGAATRAHMLQSRGDVQMSRMRLIA